MNMMPWSHPCHNGHANSEIEAPSPPSSERESQKLELASGGNDLLKDGDGQPGTTITAS